MNALALFWRRNVLLWRIFIFFRLIFVGVWACPRLPRPLRGLPTRFASLARGGGVACCGVLVLAAFTAARFRRRTARSARPYTRSRCVAQKHSAKFCINILKINYLQQIKSHSFTTHYLLLHPVTRPVFLLSTFYLLLTTSRPQNKLKS
jgi:hypothetical protein